MNDPNGTKHPVLLLTRRFPDAVMARAARDYRIIANDDDHPYSPEEIARAGRRRRCAAGKRRRSDSGST